MLKLLQFTDNHWRYPSLERIAIIGAQHIMESTLCLFRNLKMNGLLASNTFLIGKCYSTSKSVFDDFLNEGFNVSPSSFYFDSHLSYDSVYRNNIAEFVKDAIGKIDFTNIDKLIIIDDGGYLIRHVNALEISVPVVSIEQTSSGVNYLQDAHLNIPVLNVARSQAKLELETPFIVESCMNRLLQYISHEDFKNRNALILGAGAVGSALSVALKDVCSVEIFDPRFSDGSHLIPALKQTDLVIGCSGSSALHYDQYKYLKDGAMLASFSSSDREFEAYKFRKLFPRTNNCLSSFHNNRLLLIQSGFPINFWGSRNNMSLDKIQITLSLLLTAIYQALYIEADQRGIIRLDEESERLIMSEFSELFIRNSDPNS